MLAAASFGILLSADQQQHILALAPLAFMIVSALLAWFNRSKVFAPDTTQALVIRAANTGNVDIGKPPDGKPQG